MNRHYKYNEADPPLCNRYKPRNTANHISYKTEMPNENSVDDRLELIRRKYASKEKNIFTLRGEDHSKQKSRQPLREYTHYHTQNNINPAEQGSKHKRQQSGDYLEQIKQRHQRSKQKVCQRVQNIKKINDKIKSILTKFDMDVPQRQNILKRDKTHQRLDLQSSLNARKVQDQLKFEGSKSTSKFSPFSFQNYSSLKKLNHFTYEMPQNQSLNSTVDQSFLKKYNSVSLIAKSNEVKNLVSKLCTQIEHDEKYRTSKYIFSLNQNQDKYIRLQQQFQRQGIKYSLQQLVEQMRFVQGEFDPFMDQTLHENYQKYANALIVANTFWTQSIHKKFSYSRLKSDGIQESLVSDSGYNNLTVSDLVRFVNLTSGNLYKNRDLIVIMKRMSDGVLSLNHVFGSLCRDYYQ